MYEEYVRDFKFSFRFNIMDNLNIFTICMVSELYVYRV